MALSAGMKLGPYEIQSPLGAGGMGEVYKARDTRLERTVAIKVLNSKLIASPEVKARFEREAKVISQLQHPNICVLHDIGNESGTDFLVMEFLEGESLADRLKKGPLAAPELLRIAIEIADALQKAHRAGVVHRDLKPGNVMLTKSGAKLLDFGLAKPVAAGVASGAGSAASVSVFAAAMTQTSPAASTAPPLSTAGALIGTVQYMSPEQIQGVEADARSDIFAFGVMLFEMTTGKRAFEGKTQASIVGQILAVDPPAVSTVRPDSPPGLDRVICICLEKDPDERLQTAHDLKLELQRIAEVPADSPHAAAAAPSRMRWLPWIAVGVLAIAAIALGFAYFAVPRAPQTSVHSYVLPPDKSEFNFLANWSGPVVVSPDGRRVAFIAKKPGGSEDVLWIQPLNSPTAQPMAGTEGAGYPFWSYDSRFVGFFAKGKLEKIDANGGPPQALCDSSFGRGGAWNQEDVILFAPSTNQGLFKVSAAGGTAVPVTTLRTKSGETSHRWPQFLPDGNHFIFWTQTPGSAEGGGIYAGSLDGKDSKLLVRTASSGAYADPGYLLFVRDGALMAQKFSTRKLELEGDAVPITDHVAVNTSVYRSIVTVSGNGTLLYLGSGESSGSHLNWYGRDGKQAGTATPDAAQYLFPALSPDGRRVSVSIESGSVTDIWIIDLQRQTRTRLTFGQGRATWSLWSPDGRWIYYSLNSGAESHIYRRAADGTGNAEAVLATDGVSEYPTSITADGKYLSYFREDKKIPSGYDVYVLPLTGDRKPIAQVTTKFTEVIPRFSPDGKWLAYMSNESSRMEIYVKPFPGEAGKYQVSTDGGNVPYWRSDGRELYFIGGTDTIMAVDARANGSALELGTPHQVLKALMVTAPQGPYTVSADGKKFLVNQVGDQKVFAPLTLVTNWTADLKK
ncbi:MAG: protein kinase domain-containing protein [Terriglobales bacterium]